MGGAVVSRPLVLAVGVLYPAYASFKALESLSAVDEQDNKQQWLTYWVVFAFTSSVEEVAGAVLAYLPGYYVVKTLFLLWLMLPKTRGAVVLYTSFLRPLLKQYEPFFDAKLRAWRQAADANVLSILKSAREYVKTQLPSLLQD